MVDNEMETMWKEAVVAYFNELSRDRSDGIATDYGLDGRGSILGMSKHFSLLHRVQAGSEAHST
jgi:hypothetical protein